MARPAIEDASSSITLANLPRLLSRLEQRLTSTSSSLTPLDRAKLTANLEYARQLLHKLETSSDTIKSPSQRQRIQTDLGQHKQKIRRLNEALHTVPARGNWEVSDEEEDEEEREPMEDEDDDYASLARPSATTATTSTAAVATSPVITSHPTTAPSATSSALRNRFPPKKTAREERTELFGKAADASEGDAEALLDQQRRQQEDLTEEMLKMAQMLKESSLEFGKNLEDEKGYLDHAADGLERNARGMDAAGRSMDNLRKNETVSYYWAIIYMACIIGLVFLTLIILFLAPKLRW